MEASSVLSRRGDKQKFSVVPVTSQQTQQIYKQVKSQYNIHSATRIQKRNHVTTEGTVGYRPVDVQHHAVCIPNDVCTVFIVATGVTETILRVVSKTTRMVGTV